MTAALTQWIRWLPRMPVEQVGAKASCLRILPQRAVGCGHDSDVHRQRVAATDGDHRVRFENAKELRLHVQGQLRDLVQEEGPLVRELDVAGSVAVCAGERTAYVTEQLALEEVRGQRRAIDGAERPLATR